MEARVKVDGSQADGFRASFGRLAKEIQSVQSEVNKNNNKWTDDYKKKLKELEDQTKRVKREASRDYEKTVLDNEKRYRSGAIDSRDLRYQNSEARFRMTEDRDTINDLTDGISELKDALKSNSSETKEERSVFRALMSQKILGYSESMLNNTQNYGLMAGFNPGNILGSTAAFASRGTTTTEKMKLGIAGFVIQSLYEGITKSLRDGETAQRAMNEVRGLGNQIVPRFFGEYVKSAEASRMADLGINAAQSIKLRGDYAKTTGGGNMADFLKSYEIGRAYNVDLTGMNTSSRYFRGGSGADATLNLFRKLNGVGGFSEGNTSTGQERMGIFSQLIQNSLRTNENVDFSKIADIQAIFARELKISGNNPEALRMIEGVNGTISNPSGGAQQVMALRAAQKAYPQYSNDISMLNRVVSQGLRGENGTGYAQELMNLINKSTFSDSERRLVVDEYFKDLPITVRDSLMKPDFFRKPTDNGGFGGYSAGAQENTFFGDQYSAQNFNLAADVGEDFLKALYDFSEGLQNVLSKYGGFATKIVTAGAPKPPRGK